MYSPGFVAKDRFFLFPYCRNMVNMRIVFLYVYTYVFDLIPKKYVRILSEDT